MLCEGPLKVQRQEPGKLKGPVLSLDKKPRAVNGLLCPTSANRGREEYTLWGQEPSKKLPRGECRSPEPLVSDQRANGCQDVDEQARAGEVSGVGLKERGGEAGDLPEPQVGQVLTGVAQSK